MLAASTVTKIASIIALPVIGFVVAVLFLGLSRKITARIHRRYGPPLYQPIIDVVKLLTQKENISHGILFDLGILLGLAGALLTIVFIPAGGIHPLSTSGDFLVVLYLMLLSPLGLALAAGASANPNASIGVSRKFLLALGYEVPFLMAALAVMTGLRTTSLVDIVASQQGSVLQWGAVAFPLPALATFLILPAMLGIRPFDFAAAPQEIASGPLVEFGGKYLAFAAIQGALHTYIVLALFVDLFLGGGANLLTFLGKMLAVFFAGICINAVLPRFRVEQGLRYLWKWPAILAFVGLLIVALWPE
jgi:NADH-quinone oxidoreductase subunit H